MFKISTNNSKVLIVLRINSVKNKFGVVPMFKDYNNQQRSKICFFFLYSVLFMGYVNTLLLLLHLEHGTQSPPREEQLYCTCRLECFIIYVIQE